MKCQFASDNTAGICPQAWEAMKEANEGFVSSYGDDEVTTEVCDLFRELFETDCDVYFVFNGTAANALSLATLCQPYHGIIAHEFAHVEGDECGAPEFFTAGTKLLLAPGANGKLTPKAIEKVATFRTDIHFPKPKGLSLTNPTEFGTLYTLDEMKAIGETAHQHGLKVHLDGARFANAVAALKVSPAELTWKCGVDVLCFGGTKLGLGVGEAVIFFNRELSSEFAYRCKQAGQLASKMRYLSGPWRAILRDETWIRIGEHSNAMAGRLEAGIWNLGTVQFRYPVETNGLFIDLDERVNRALRDRGWYFYTRHGMGTRFMCSWQTTEADVDALIADIRDLS